MKNMEISIEKIHKQSNKATLPHPLEFAFFITTM